MSTAATSTQSVWDGQTLLAERDSDGTLYRYVHGPDGSPLSLVRTRPGAADVRFNYHTDALGSVVAITSEGGTVVASYRYGAFGELVSIGGSDAALAERNPLRYRAYYYDTHAALYYLPARYYDPATARFLSPDPALASAGDPRTLDRYMYCTGDPVNYYDPTGAVTDLEWGAWEYYYSKDPVTAGDRPAAQAASSAVHAAANANKAAGTSAAAAAAERARIAAAAVAAAERAAALAEREETGDGTPYGRNNREMWPSRPDNTTWMLVGVNAVTDGLTPLFGPAWLIPMIVGAAVDGCYSEFYYQPRRERGDATYGDVMITRLSAVPCLGTAISLGTVIGYNFIPWSEPDY